MIAAESQVTHIVAEVIDSVGVIVPDQHIEIQFDVQGPAKTIGVDNGDLWSIESYTANYRETRDGRCLLVLKTNGEGKITVTATGGGLKSSALILNSY
ncbi:MAG: hypothetical protein HC819_21415 [Cyclobacteriaceae bacterium]|nr:hypothetical protein [Cyclobacteriaceae bacterium]